MPPPGIHLRPQGRWPGDWGALRRRRRHRHPALLRDQPVPVAGGERRSDLHLRGRGGRRVRLRRGPPAHHLIPTARDVCFLADHVCFTPNDGNRRPDLGAGSGVAQGQGYSRFRSRLGHSGFDRRPGVTGKPMVAAPRSRRGERDITLPPEARGRFNFYGVSRSLSVVAWSRGQRIWASPGNWSTWSYWITKIGTSGHCWKAQAGSVLAGK